MNVLLIPEFQSFGGTRTFFFKLLELHQKHKITTTVILEKGQLDVETELFLRKRSINLFLITKRKSIQPYRSLFFEFRNYYKIITKQRFDLIVVSNSTPSISFGVFLFNTPVLFFMHTYPWNKSWRIRGPRLITQFLSCAKKRFITVSNFSAQRIHEYMMVPKKYIDVVYNSYTPPLKNSAPAKNNIVLTIGHVIAYKNPYIWVEVAKNVIQRSPGIKFIWVGDGPLLGEMRDVVKRMGLSQQISFFGYSDNMQNFYSKAKVYFQPSLLESHGICVVEAMSHGLPCVVSDVGGLPESVINEKTGFVCNSNDIEAYAKSILACLNDSEICRKFGEAGRERAELHFNKNLQEKKILDLYHKVLQTNKKI